MSLVNCSMRDGDERNDNVPNYDNTLPYFNAFILPILDASEISQFRFQKERHGHDMEFTRKYQIVMICFDMGGLRLNY